MHLTLHDLDQFWKHGLEPKSGLRLVCYIGTELITALVSCQSHHDKQNAIDHEMDRLCRDIDWAQTFDHQTLILIYDDVIMPEVLVAMHNWFRKKSADLRQVQIVVTHQLGVAAWWQDWCRIMHTKSFTVVDSLPSPRMTKAYFQPLDVGRITASKNINHHFSFYGGTYSKLDRDYLTVLMSQFQHCAVVDRTGDMCRGDDLRAYLENITYYTGQQEVDDIMDLYDRSVINLRFQSNSPSTTCARRENEPIDLDGFQWEIDQRCFASVIRETQMDDMFVCVTEKTHRAFMHQCVVIPTGFRSVEQLEWMGYYFPHDVFDYRYQYINDWHQRMMALCAALEKFSCIPVQRLKDIYLDLQPHVINNCKLSLNLLNPQSVIADIGSTVNTV